MPNTQRTIKGRLGKIGLWLFCGCCVSNASCTNSRSWNLKFPSKVPNASTLFPVSHNSGISEASFGIAPSETAKLAEEVRFDEPRSDSLNGGKLTEDQAKWYALSNSQVIRRDADFLGVINGTAIEGLPSVIDPHITRTGFLYGQRGTQAALSDMDWRWTRQFGLGQNELIQNNRFLSGGIPPGGTLSSQTSQYITSANKNLWSGGQVRVLQQWDYSKSNVQDAFYPSSFTGLLRGEYRQPLLAGSGRTVTRVAGPLNGTIDGVTGVSQGVIVSKLQEREAVEQLRLNVDQLIRDVEVVYVQLATSQEVVKLLNSSKARVSEIASQVAASVQANAKGGQHDILQIAQVRDQIDVSILTEMRNFQTLSTRLARLTQTALDVGGLELEPPEEPFPLVVDIESTVAGAAQNRSDIRILDIREHSLRMQYAAARNLNRMQLDFVTGVNLNGFGDKLFAEDTPGPDSSTASVIRNLYTGKNTGWDARFEMSSPLGRRLARVRMQNIELQLQKIRSIRESQLQELRLEIQQVAQDLQLLYETSTTRAVQVENSMRAIRSLEARQSADFQVENAVQLVGAIQSYFNEMAELLRSKAEYRNALSELLYRQGLISIESNWNVQSPSS